MAVFPVGDDDLPPMAVVIPGMNGLSGGDLDGARGFYEPVVHLLPVVDPAQGHAGKGILDRAGRAAPVEAGMGDVVDAHPFTHAGDEGEHHLPGTVSVGLLGK